MSSHSLNELFTSYYSKYVDHLRDHRVKDWPLVSSPWPLFIVLSYIYFSKVSGPRFMKDRKPYDIKRVVQIFNFLQIVVSVGIIVNCLQGGWLFDINLLCEPVDYSNSARGLEIARWTWWTFLSKIWDLFDTILFILSKKFNQVTNLHVIHHSSIVFMYWVGMLFGPGGQPLIGAMVNAAVHVIMYSYYFVASLGETYKRFLWWKKYLTTIQIMQFVFVIGHGLLPLFYPCGYSKGLSYFLLFFVTIYLAMFVNFFVKTYIKTQIKAKAERKAKRIEKRNQQISSVEKKEKAL